MTLPPVYLFSEPYEMAPELTPKEVFLYRIIHREFSNYMKEEIEDDFFIDCMDAAFRSRAAGPAPWCAMYMWVSFNHVISKYNRQKSIGNGPCNQESIKLKSFFQKHVCEYPCTREEREKHLERYKNLDTDEI